MWKTFYKLNVFPGVFHMCVFVAIGMCVHMCNFHSVEISVAHAKYFLYIKKLMMYHMCK